MDWLRARWTPKGTDMALDLTRTAAQIDEMAAALKGRRGDKRARLERAMAAAQALDPQEYEARRLQLGTQINRPPPTVSENPCVAYAPPPLPSDYAVVGVDGSHIDVSRHLAARCYLINIGGIALRYGATPQASAFSKPRLYADEDELVIRDEYAPQHQETVSGALLDAKRAVEEALALAHELERLPADAPALGLMDGSLIMFGMHRHPDFVRRQLIDDGFVAAMDAVRELAGEREVAAASYISLPRSADVASALRLVDGGYPAPADADVGEDAGGVMDRELFAMTLAAGERTPVFRSNAHIVRDHYGKHGVCFFYLRTEEEIGRVELPDWAAADEALLALVHGLVVEQCRLGPGYPVALKEAHEQAVVTGADRQYFVGLVEAALSDNGLPVYSSEKNNSKRYRWL